MKLITRNLLFVALAPAVILAAQSGNLRAADTPAAPPPPAIPAGTPAKFTDSTTWIADGWHTSVNFTISHLGLSMVHGKFADFSGTIVADPNHLDRSSVQFSINPASVDTSIKMRDDDLRSGNFFDVAKYPTITFASTNIEKKAHGYVAHGNLTIHGVTKAIDLPFTVSNPIHDPFGGIRFGLLAHAKINRLDYGMGFDADKLANGALAVGKDVNIDISLEAIPPPPAK